MFFKNLNLFRPHWAKFVLENGPNIKQTISQSGLTASITTYLRFTKSGLTASITTYVSPSLGYFASPMRMTHDVWNYTYRSVTNLFHRPLAADKNGPVNILAHERIHNFHYLNAFSWNMWNIDLVKPFYKKWRFSACLPFIFGLFKQQCKFYNKSMWKMSFLYLAPGF